MRRELQGIIPRELHCEMPSICDCDRSREPWDRTMGDCAYRLLGFEPSAALQHAASRRLDGTGPGIRRSYAPRGPPHARLSGYCHRKPRQQCAPHNCSRRWRTGLVSRVWVVLGVSFGYPVASPVGKLRKKRAVSITELALADGSFAAVSASAHFHHIAFHTIADGVGTLETLGKVYIYMCVSVAQHVQDMDICGPIYPEGMTSCNAATSHASGMLHLIRILRKAGSTIMPSYRALLLRWLVLPSTEIAAHVKTCTTVAGDNVLIWRHRSNIIVES